MRPCLFTQSLFALPLHKAIRVAAQIGAPAVEIACWRPHLDRDRARWEGEGVAAQLRAAGLEVAALSLSNEFTDPACLDAQVAAAAQFIGLAGAFQTEMVKLTPGPPSSADATRQHWECLERAIGQLVPCAERAGVKLAFETHMRQLTDTLESSLRLLNLAPHESVGLTVDFCNLAFAGEDLAEAVRLLGPRTFHTHVKNGHVGAAGEWHFTALDTGLVDYATVLGLLSGLGYAGCLSIECLGPEAQSAPADTARRDLGILNCWLKQIPGDSQGQVRSRKVKKCHPTDRELSMAFTA